MKPAPLAASLFLLATLVACGKSAPSNDEQAALPAAPATPGPADMLAKLPHDTRPYGLDVYAAKCTSCHGALGQGDAANPALKGMTRAAMYQTLLDYRSGKIQGVQPAVMTKAIADLSEAELAAASVYAGE